MPWLEVGTGIDGLEVGLLTSPGGYFWPVWPMLGMSIAVLIALYRAFGPLPQAVAATPEPPPAAPPM